MNEKMNEINNSDIDIEIEKNCLKKIIFKIEDEFKNLQFSPYSTGNKIFLEHFLFFIIDEIYMRISEINKRRKNIWKYKFEWIK